MPILSGTESAVFAKYFAADFRGKISNSWSDMSLQSRRVSLGLSQSRLAREAGVSRYKICTFEMGSGSLSGEELDRIRKAFHSEASRLWSIAVALPDDDCDPASALPGPQDQDPRSKSMASESDATRSVADLLGSARVSFPLRGPLSETDYATLESSRITREIADTPMLPGVQNYERREFVGHKEKLDFPISDLAGLAMFRRLDATEGCDAIDLKEPGSGNRQEAEN